MQNEADGAISVRIVGIAMEFSTGSCLIASQLPFHKPLLFGSTRIVFAGNWGKYWT